MDKIRKRFGDRTVMRAAGMCRSESPLKPPIATLLFGEVLAPVQMLGGVLVIAGVLLAESGRGNAKARPPRPTEGSDGGTGPMRARSVEG